MSYTKFKGITEIGHSLLNEQLEANLVEFLNWGFLGIGGFFNVEIPTSGAYGGNQHKLRSVVDPYYSNGRVWEGFRSNWVWESGVEYSLQPIQISGVFINNTFYSTATTGTYAYHINYPLGRVVFDSAISTNSNVTVEYSYRWINCQTSNCPWFKELMFRSFRVDDPHFLQLSSGNWSILGQNRLQLPAIIVESVPRRKFVGMQLGGGQIVYNDVLFHIFTENPWDRNNLVDTITLQNNKTIKMFNLNNMASNNRFPLDYNGSIAPSALTYPDLLNSFYWRDAIIEDTTVQNNGNFKGLYASIIKSTLEIRIPEI